MKNKFTLFVEAGGGYWCPKCQAGVEVSETEWQDKDFIYGETCCSNCGSTLHCYTIPLTVKGVEFTPTHKGETG